MHWFLQLSSEANGDISQTSQWAIAGCRSDSDYCVTLIQGTQKNSATLTVWPYSMTSTNPQSFPLADLSLAQGMIQWRENITVPLLSFTPSHFHMFEMSVESGWKLRCSSWRRDCRAAVRFLVRWIGHRLRC